ncbi:MULTISPECIES: Imm21 family immunity protein [Streptomyces]|uniref:Imm21 family immunity protein n=1 Tax=Streptomyces TaxID=1883 RepID=UPI0029CB6EDC|nr:Imm21 family immunity protein [Streptomyces sp. F8]MDX6758616.1 Imm21 family immunity protein [Streptomyces sp. F8]
MISANWLDGTDFGYYALCPASYLQDWDGSEADEVFQAYVSKVTLPDGGEVLTIGGEALPVAYFPESMTFVQSVCADEGVDLHEEVERAVEAQGWQDAVEIALGGRYFLIDSGVPGAGTEEEYMIQVDIPHGRYQVQTLSIDVLLGEFYLHRLKPSASSCLGHGANH